jgi:hypothetical protein
VSLIELWAVKAFCLKPVIACLFFVASVLSMLEMQVSLIELWAVKAFCHKPVIACLFFVASVVYVGEASRGTDVQHIISAVVASLHNRRCGTLSVRNRIRVQAEVD